MPFVLTPDFLAPPSINRPDYRFAASVSASTEAPTLSASTDVTAGEASTLNLISEIAPAVEIDWDSKTAQIRFAALERKVGRDQGSDEEINEYHQLLQSRRGWVHAQTYLTDYIEEEREKAVLRKLEELQKLLRPIRV